MNIGLDNIGDLVINGTRRPRIVEEYSLNALQNMKNTNCKELGILIKNISSDIQNINNEQTRRMIEKKLKFIIDCFEKNMDFNPKEYYENNDCMNFTRYIFKICDFKAIGELLNELYIREKIAERKYPNDVKPIVSMSNKIKESCKNLGIKTLTEGQLYDAYMNPDSDMAYDIGIRYDLDYENAQEDDIIINAIPYFITYPNFGVNNTILGYINYPINEARAYYNEKKYDELMGNQSPQMK